MKLAIGLVPTNIILHYVAAEHGRSHARVEGRRVGEKWTVGEFRGYAGDRFARRIVYEAERKKASVKEYT
jgi:hypothetical protein